VEDELAHGLVERDRAGGVEHLLEAGGDQCCRIVLGSDLKRSRADVRNAVREAQKFLRPVF
jgi:hypothetical protein